jgi:hypothetical protein
VPYLVNARSTKLAQATILLAQHIANAVAEKEEASDVAPKVMTGRLPVLR